jgi:hypothetical protein
MAIIPQISMFSWEKDINNLGDLERLQSAIKNLPDEGLMQKLEKGRKGGRDDYPVRAMWNMLIAMFVFGYSRYTGIIRELKRNAQLRYICGFGFGKTPDSYNVSRYLARLEAHQEEVSEIFNALVRELYGALPDFGEDLSMDSKWIESLANRVSKVKEPDRRSEVDAEWGTKEYHGVNKDGSEWGKKEHCFGFKLHLINEATYELPIAYIMSGAAGSDIKYGKKLIGDIVDGRPYITDKCKHLMADRGYDSTDFIQYLKESCKVKAVIDKRMMWKTEIEKEVPGYPGIYYNEKGEVFCYSPERGDRHEMRPCGYDAERDVLRMKCPARMYDITCREAEACTHCKTIRVPLKTDERIFTQVARPSYKWQRKYKKRVSTERVFSRLDVSFGFEEKRLRGLARMELLTVMALAVMNAMAVGRIKQGKPELMRSLVKAA